MKILKNTIGILLCLTFINCSQEEVNKNENNAESQTLNELTISGRQNNFSEPIYIEWLRGEWIKTIVDGILVDERCGTGIGVCIIGVHEAVFSHMIGGGVPVKASYSDGILEVEFLDEFITYDEVEQIWGSYELNMSVNDIYEMFKSRVNIQQEAYIGTEITTELITESDGWELKMIPGEYTISYTDDAPFGVVMLPVIPITDPEKENKEKSNKNAKNLHGGGDLIFL